MNDDEFDALRRDAAGSYNVPPDAPREAMWDAIARGRVVTAIPRPEATGRGRRWLTAAAGIAAVLLVGIAIGRASRGVSTGPVVVATHTPVPANAAPRDTFATEAVASRRTPDGVTDAEMASPRASRGLAASRQASANPLRRAARGAAGAVGDLPADAGAYQLAVVEHLTRSELLLTSFRSDARSGNIARLDAQFASLARELLGTTRLLLATRRGDDAAITRLLQDLEFVLMQLSQYANDGRRIDLDAINQSLDRRNVIPKLRSSIPAGVSTSAGT